MATAQQMSADESHCVLCWEDMEFSACGSCDHPICLKCCVKLRLLRKEYDCPVCRAQLKEVIVSKGYKSWSEKSSRPRRQLHARSFGIVHETRESQSKVDEILEHRCQECNELFKSFPQVKSHVRNVHAMMFCDICVRHLKIFTHERKCYTREALVRHRREGDPDDRSHRGHPLCQFCDNRYLDNDELLVHLRKNHFWCHLCEKDGSQDYYPDYKVLRKHFKQAHFLCEEGECVHKKFTSVFRMKVDYQAHIAQTHSARLSKAEARQMRQLDVNITFARREDSNGFVSAEDYNFPEQGYERHRERSRMTSGAAGRNSEPRDSGRHRGNEKPPEKEAPRRVTQDVKSKPYVHKGRQNDVGVKDPEDHKGAGRSNIRSPKDVLECDHKRPPGDPLLQSETNKTRILEGDSRNSKVNNAEKKGANSGKGSRESDKVRTKKNDSNKNELPQEGLGSVKEKQQKLDEGNLSSKGKKAKTKVQESNKNSSDQKVHDKSKTKSNDLIQEGNVDPLVAQRTKDSSQENTNSFLSSTIVDPASKMDLPIPSVDKKQQPVVNYAKPKRTYDSEFPSFSDDSSKVNQSFRPPPGLGVPPGFSSELFASNLNQNDPSIEATVESGPKFSDLHKPNTKTKKPKEEMVDPGKSLVKSAPKTNVPNEPAPKPTYDSEFPTLAALTNGHKTSSSIRAPPGLAPPGFQAVTSLRPPPGMGWSVPLNMGGSSARETPDQKLLSDIKRILNFRGVSFERFQQVQSFYRQGKTSPDKYYEECCALFGEDDIHKVFRGLIDFLPDEDKKKQLLLVYNDAKVTAKLGGGSVRTNDFDVGFNNESVESREVAKSDGTLIVQPALEDDFPALSKATGKKNKSTGKVSNAWTRAK